MPFLFGVLKITKEKERESKYGHHKKNAERDKRRNRIIIVIISTAINHHAFEYSFLFYKSISVVLFVHTMSDRNPS